MLSRVLLLSSLLLSSPVLAPVGAARAAAAFSPSEPLGWPSGVSDARPWAYNWWLGSAVDPENLRRELERYREGGLGGVHIVPIYGAKGAEDRYIPYLSPRWLEMLSVAVNEAGRLGLGVDMTTGTGWCFGGPHVTRELGCRQRVVAEVPLPEGGRLPEALRPDRVTLQAVVARGPDGERRDLTDGVAPDGRLDGRLDGAPDGPGWTLEVLGHRFTNRRVKRAAPGGAGPMINPFYAEAMRRHLEPFSEAFVDGVARPRAMYHDSFEYSGDWTPDFPEQFARRRGYRIEGEIPALAGRGDPERVARVRCDVQETLSDVMVEEVFPQWIRWCRDRSILTRMQAHGAPGNWLDLYALADIPETEMFGHGGPDPLISRFDEHVGGADRDPLISKFASSAAHLAGRSLVGAETGTWLAEHFCETFEELKAEIDLLFLAGVNHVIYHGCVYSPDDAAWPGWLFYASTQMNPRNPLWREAGALSDYVARCQSVLRSGRPDEDVLLYWPIHDAWSRGVRGMSVHDKAALKGPLGDVARHLQARGVGFDYASDRLVRTLGTRGGRVRGPRGTEWRAIVVPSCRHLPLGTLRTLLDLAGAGATVIFPGGLPVDVPGLGDLESRRASFRELVEPLRRTLWGDGAPVPAPEALRSIEPREAARGMGRLVVGPLDAALELAGVERESMVDIPGLRLVRRRHEEGRHYLIVHHGQRALDGWVPLATPARSAAGLDPMTGRAGVLGIRQRAGGRPEVRLRLEPGHSIILRTFEERTIEGPAFEPLAPGEALGRIDGPWKVDFVAGGPGRPAPIEVERLASWTTFGRSELEAFAGTARYRVGLHLSESELTARDRPLLLDLGEVRHVARVRLNGADLGARFFRPHRWTLPAGLLRAGENRLEVEVTNLAANRIRDLDRRKVPWRVFHDINLVNIRYRAFDASGWPLAPSGLVGPVRLLRARVADDE